jgi:hypothetical protein
MVPHGDGRESSRSAVRKSIPAYFDGVVEAEAFLAEALWCLLAILWLVLCDFAQVHRAA